MNRALPSLFAAGLVAGLIGCQPAPQPPAATTASNTTSAVSSNFTLVTLSVPNMT